MKSETTETYLAGCPQSGGTSAACKPSDTVSWTRIGLLLAGAFCYAAAFPPLEIAVTGWLAPLLWLFALHDLGSRKRFAVGFLGGFTASAIVLLWLWPIFSALSLFLWGITALYFGLWGFAAGAFRIGRLLTPLWVAVAWCGVEYLRGEIAPLSFSWMALGYSQQNLAGYAIASLVGVYGLSLVMVFWAGCAFELSKRFVESGFRPKRLLIFGATLTILIPIGSLLKPPPWNGSIVGYAELQQYREQDEIASLPVPETPPLARTDLVVLPEYCLFDDPYANHSSWFLDLMRLEASAARWGVIFGAIDVPPGKPREEGYRNTAFYLDHSGQLMGRAVKNQPIQLLRDGDPAADVVVMDIGSTTPQSQPLRAGVGICYDATFQRYTLRMARRGADLFIFPTYNADAWGASQYRQHQRMFQTRAAETKRPFLVAATSGPTFAAFPGGTASAVLPFQRTDRLTVPIAAAGQVTPFVTAGWLIGPASVALTIMGVLASFVRSRARHRRPTVPTAPI